MAGKIFDRRRREASDAAPDFADYIKVTLATDTSAWGDIPVDIGPEYEGERIRKDDMYVEFGGPHVDYKGERVVYRECDEIEDEKVTIIGKDIDELEEGKSYPIFILVELCGKLSPEMENTLQTRIHHWGNFINGWMHLNWRDEVWMRVSKAAYEKGFTLKHLGTVLTRLYKAELPVVDKAQITIVTTDEEKVKELLEDARAHWKEMDERLRTMKEEETRPWYSCTLCQSFATSNVCIITPERPSSCGAITWYDAKAGYEMDPGSSWQPFDPGECLDPLKGEWSGVNEEVAKRSGGVNTRYYLHSLFGYPHTSCGCFESVSFYMPEVDGIGIVERAYKGICPNKLPFSTMAARTGGGQQTEGLLGTSSEYMRSRKFWQADGGWYRVVWMPKYLKEEVKDAIPEEMWDKIATEEDANTMEELKEFLKKVDHPVVKGMEVKTEFGTVKIKGWEEEEEITMDDILEYIEEHEGELDVEECAEELGTTEEVVMRIVEKMIEEGILEA
ncbi:MAG: CO dehydrogenase/CO-methylating acetyl-CoA synthase complex subunit beta [Candidatus Syntropharchaeia archaeon]